MPLLPKSMIVEIEALLESRLVPEREDAFALRQLDEIVEWSGPISAELNVRVLLALQSVNRSAAFSDVCADAIVASPDWRELVREMLSMTRIGPHVMLTAAKVLRRCAPEHALAALPNDGIGVVRVCDAIDDGTTLRVTQTGWSGMGDGPCWLVGLEDPVGQCVTADVSGDGSTVVILPGPADWLERNRLACPAFLAVMA